MDFFEVWSSYDIWQLTQATYQCTQPPAAGAPDPVEDSINSLTLPTVYTPLSFAKLVPGSTIQSQTTEAIYSMLTLIDELGVSLVGSTKWDSIYEEEQGRVEPMADLGANALQLLPAVSGMSNSDLYTYATQLLINMNQETNRVARVQLFVQSRTPIDHGREEDTQYTRFNMMHKDDVLVLAWNVALWRIRSMEASFKPSSNLTRHCNYVGSIFKYKVGYNKKKVYQLKVRGADLVNLLLLPGDILQLGGKTFVLSLNSTYESSYRPTMECIPKYVMTPIEGLDSMRKVALVQLKVQVQSSVPMGRQVPVLYGAGTLFACYTQCLFLRNQWLGTDSRGLCAVVAFFDGSPYSLKHASLSPAQVTKTLAFYSCKDEKMHFLPTGERRIAVERTTEIGESANAHRNRQGTAPRQSELSYYSCVESLCDSGTGAITATSNNIGTPTCFSRYDIFNYIPLMWPFTNRQTITSLNCDIFDDLWLSNSVRKEELRAIQEFVRRMGYATALMYATPMAIAEHYITWINYEANAVHGVLYIYDYGEAHAQLIHTVPLHRHFAPYVPKRSAAIATDRQRNGTDTNTTTGNSEANNIISHSAARSQPALPVKQIYIIEHTRDLALLLLAPRYSNFLFYASFTKASFPANFSTLSFDKGTVIDALNTDLVLSHGILLAATRVLSKNIDSKMAQVTSLNILLLDWSRAEHDTAQDQSMYRGPTMALTLKHQSSVVLTVASTPVKAIVFLGGMRFAVHMEQLSYYYLVDFRIPHTAFQGELPKREPLVYAEYMSVTPIYTACRSINTLLYNNDGRHIIIFERGENYALIYDIHHTRNPKHFLLFPAGDRVNCTAVGGTDGLVAFGCDHTVSVYNITRESPQRITVVSYVTQGRALGMSWVGPYRLQMVTEQVVYTLSLSTT